jgi:type IV secretory pathway TraG/TraD family ATPase VirD4
MKPAAVLQHLLQPEINATFMPQRIATAEWADPSGIEKKYGYKNGTIWLGRGPNQRAIGYGDDRHVTLVGNTRGGKGTTSIIPTLLTWRGSLCVVDPKGENATVTAARRGAGSEYCVGLNQTVHVLDPFRVAVVEDSVRSRFNPLDALDPQADETIDEAGRIADALVVVRETSNEPFWDESARDMVKILILHVLTHPHYEGRRNLVTVRRLITRGDWESVEALRQAGEGNIPPAQGLLWSEVARNPSFGGVVAGGGESFFSTWDKSPKVFDSVLQVANRNTEFIDSTAMQRTLEVSDFKLSDLKTRPEGVSLYLSLPQRYMNTHYRWLRMMISLTITQMEITRTPRFSDDVRWRRELTGLNSPMLVVLDEFAGLKRMEIIESAVGQIAGFGVKLFFVLQSLEQLKAVYKENWETFLANSGLKIFFNIEDHFSREYISKLIGETELMRETGSRNEAVGETESTSHGRSTSHASSVSSSEGRSRSESRSRSGGSNTATSHSQSGGSNHSSSSSFGTSSGMSYRKAGLFDLFGGRRDESYNDGFSMGSSRSDGTSEGWSVSVTEGRSSGWSDSVTGGVSTTRGESASCTHGSNDSASRGTSHTRSTGTSETLHRRPLIHPDEIGRLFATIEDRREGAYPGLALILLAGKRPGVVRRVNYYQDIAFVRAFDPHPDHGRILTLAERAQREAAREAAVDRAHEQSLSLWGRVRERVQERVRDIQCDLREACDEKSRALGEVIEDRVQAFISWIRN